MKKHKTIELQGLRLVPPHPSKCQECAVDHEPDFPHNRDSLYYGMKFKMEHNRDPTWEDALAHCSEEMYQLWYTELATLGITIKARGDA